MMKYFLKADFIMFDLDNTLYDEKEFLFGAYKTISFYLENKYSINNELIYNNLTNHFELYGRKNIFNQLIINFKIPDYELLNFLNILRKYKPIKKYTLFAEIKPLFNQLIKLNKIFIIVTNGNVEQQQNKIKNINWEDLSIPKVFYANNYSPKPSPRIYLEKIGPFYNLKDNSNLLFIGDSNEDKIFSKNIGAKFYDINKYLKKYLF
jgi:putative hydrolase of the HAD superfamily